MVLVKILKRRDASSVVVAILLAMIITQPLTTTTGRLASVISGLGSKGPFGYGPGGSWKEMYLFPVVWALVQIVILEILGWIYILGMSPLRRRR
jgi:hypothetical protein